MHAGDHEQDAAKALEEISEAQENYEEKKSVFIDTELSWIDEQEKFDKAVEAYSRAKLAY